MRNKLLLHHSPAFLALALLWLQVEQDDLDNDDYTWDEEMDSSQQKQRCYLAKLFLSDGIGRFTLPDISE